MESEHSYGKWDIKAWIDENKNGEWDNSEEPLKDIRFAVEGARRFAVLENDVEGGAFLTVFWDDCDCRAFEVVVEVPPGFTPATPERISIDPSDEEPILFGFTYRDTPSP